LQLPFCICEYFCRDEINDADVRMVDLFVAIAR